MRNDALPGMIDALPDARRAAQGPSELRWVERAVTDQARTTRRLTGGAGLLAAILFGAGNALWAFHQPASGAPADQILAFYRANANRIVAGASISLVSFVPFTVFSSGVRTLLRQADRTGILAATAFGGGILLVGAGLGAETINLVGATRAAAHGLTTALGVAVFEISYALGYSAAGIGAGILLLAVAAVRLQRRPPPALAATAFLVIVGCCFLTPLSRWLLAPTVVLLAVISASLLRAESPVPR